MASSSASSAEPQLHEVHAQHALGAGGLSAYAPGAGVGRLHKSRQPRPRHHALHLGQKLLSPRHLLLCANSALAKLICIGLFEACVMALQAGRFRAELISISLSPANWNPGCHRRYTSYVQCHVGFKRCSPVFDIRLTVSSIFSCFSPSIERTLMCMVRKSKLVLVSFAFLASTLAPFAQAKDQSTDRTYCVGFGETKVCLTVPF
jgi:hypothetical protein